MSKRQVRLRGGAAAGFVPAIALGRTEEERIDQALAWKRPDNAFFASGACHILAFTFVEQHPGAGYRIVAIWPRDGARGSHVYVTDGTWAFDFNGWTRESVLLEETTKECRRRWPGWDYERTEVVGTLAEFCSAWPVRAPRQFAFDPRARAEAYLARFPSAPPTSSLHVQSA